MKRRLYLVVAAVTISVLAIASALSQPMFTTAQQSDVSVNGDDENRMIECKGNAVTVNGDDNNLRLQGDCSRLSVFGDDNTIAAQTVTEISILGDDNNVSVGTVARISTIGDDNNVTWEKGAGGKPPEVSNTGEDNVTRQAGE
jgi:hypothetical protein